MANPMSREELEATIKEVFENVVGGDKMPEKISGETTLDLLGADSLDQAELIMNLEERLGITVPSDREKEITNWETMVNLIEELVNRLPKKDVA